MRFFPQLTANGLPAVMTRRAPHFFLYLAIDGPQRARLQIPPTETLPSCLWSLRIFPSLPGSRLTIFLRKVSSALLHLVNPWLSYNYHSCSHAFCQGNQNISQKESGIHPVKNRISRIRTTALQVVKLRDYEARRLIA